MTPLRTLRVAGIVAAAVASAGCGAGDPDGRVLSVHAASSLTDVFRSAAERFEHEHPGVDVRLTFAGSQLLRIQIEEGAPADVFASANADHVEALARSGHVSTRRTFATNELVVVVPRDDPDRIERFVDLPRAERIVLGSPRVPAGRYARAILRAADSVYRPDFSSTVLGNVVSEETNVRLARSRVELGEANAAIVYRTDVREAEGLIVLGVPDEVAVTAEYVAAIVERGGESDLARAWLDFLESDRGRALLERYGFGVPVR